MSRPALLFDLDGTLTDADHLHFEAFNDILARNGQARISADTYKLDVMGRANVAIFAALFPDASLERRQALADEKEARFRELAHVLHPAAGLIELIARAEAAGTPCAVVTNAPRANAEHELRALGLYDRFPVVVIGEELPHSKPHPLPYLLALERLGAGAETSIGFEDSLSGLRAGLAAGLQMVGLTTSLSAKTLEDHGAALAIADYRDDRLTSLIAGRLGISL